MFSYNIIFPKLFISKRSENVIYFFRIIYEKLGEESLTVIQLFIAFSDIIYVNG